jgi:hypothetical protein
MPPAAFETTISGIERPQTHALNRSATGIGRQTQLQILKESTGKPVEKKIHRRLKLKSQRNLILMYEYGRY